MSPLDYVKNKIAEVMRGSSSLPGGVVLPEDPYHPSSSGQVEGGVGMDRDRDSSQKAVHSSDMMHYSTGSSTSSSSSTGHGDPYHRDWQTERYKHGTSRSPIRDGLVSGSKQRSPRPSGHPSGGVEEGATGSQVSSGDDILAASSSTGRTASPCSPGNSRDYPRESSEQSPLVTASEGFARSPRNSGSSSSSGLVHSSDSRQQPAQVETSGHISPKAQQSHGKMSASERLGHSPGGDHTASQSGSARSEVSSMSRDAVRPSYLSVDKTNVANQSFDSLESPQAGLVIDESAGADSSGHVDSDSPGEGQGGVSTSSGSGAEKGNVDSQLTSSGIGRSGNSEVGSSMSVQRSPHSVHSTAGSPGSAGIHPDSSHYPTRGHSTVTSGGGDSGRIMGAGVSGPHSSTDNVSTSSPSSSSVYPSYLYSALAMHSPANGGQPAPAPSSSNAGNNSSVGGSNNHASSTGPPSTREPSSSAPSQSAQPPPDSHQSPSFPQQYENLSDDD